VGVGGDGGRGTRGGRKGGGGEGVSGDDRDKDTDTQDAPEQHYRISSGSIKLVAQAFLFVRKQHFYMYS
jgi:hypothetical protein